MTKMNEEKMEPTEQGNPTAQTSRILEESTKGAPKVREKIQYLF